MDSVGIAEKFSLLGQGKHAERAIIPAFNRSKYADLKLIGRSNKANYLETVNSSQIDSVYICLPNSMHAKWTICALQAGKNVICEKPLSCSLEETEQILTAQKKSGAKILEAFMYRFHPQHKIVKKILAENKIGTPRLFEAHFHYFLDDYSNIRFSSQLGGGGLLDVGCYLIDACLFLFSDQIKGGIKSVNGSWIINRGVDEFAHANITFSSGLVANLTCGCRLNRQSSYTIFGDRGKITVRDAFKIPKNKKGLILLETVDGEKSELFSDSADHYQLMIDYFCTQYEPDLALLTKRSRLLEQWKTACAG